MELRPLKNRALSLFISLRECAGVDPLFLQDGPEVLGQTFQDVFVGKPAIAVFAPAGAPGV